MTENDFMVKFHEKSRTDLTLLVQREAGDVSEHLLVFFPVVEHEGKIGTEVVNIILEQMEVREVPRGIIVLTQPLSPFSLQRIAVWSEAQTAIKNKPHIVEHFMEKELLVNITKHMLVPKHTILTAEEKVTLLKRYKLSEGQLPRCQLIDPLARYYGLQRGDVVRIIRTSETAGRYVTYRLVT
eukprot:CAMPEP_0114550254 /NCGR_PEP_ID=MMETSP0114-20121206/5974_1 /TAXON_ID=31324 /ORGANISM="Goniomonas sp, Strain m" /LENGTH=182 /DNA_ID=CAMNT_0001735013 /DNA_START=3 /DNA_END=551 /DNA_ORIENTATION=-